ncbi:MAG: hypothetical protein RI907_4033 [Pseudomonadota bacterium]|jgi:pectin methylesterase-like acyl-CoA thioesterase
MKFAKLFAAGALLSAAVGAQAATQYLSFTALSTESITFSAAPDVGNSILGLSLISYSSAAAPSVATPSVDPDFASLWIFSGVVTGATYTVKLDTSGAALVAGQYDASTPTTSLNVTAVPEPGSVALVLAGAGVVGLVARRRKAA